MEVFLTLSDLVTSTKFSVHEVETVCMFELSGQVCVIYQMSNGCQIFLSPFRKNHQQDGTFLETLVLETFQGKHRGYQTSRLRFVLS